MGVAATRSSALRDRLVGALPADRVWGWVGSLLVTAFGGYLRFDRLRVRASLTFDETYYAKDGYSYVQYGVEAKWVNNVNALVQAGHTNIFVRNQPEFVVQPPLGKWMIAGGEWLFGLNSLGWGSSAAVFGALSILLICRIARRMTRSTLLGCIAGLLMSLDGLEFVMSRTGLLDIFLMFFILAAFGCLVIDRDVGARRAAGIGRFWRSALLRDAKWLPLSFGLVPLAVYIASWSGWFASSFGWDRQYAAPPGVQPPVLAPL